MRKFIVALSTIFLLIFISGCGTGRRSGGDMIAVSNNSRSKNYKNLESGQLFQSDRMVQYSAWIDLTVEDPESANLELSNIAKQFEGYVNNIGTYKTIIRVKSDLLDQAIIAISNIGEIESKSISGIDVTEEYADYEIRLDNAQKARQRYLMLMQQAENVEAALKVEKELERLNETIERIKGRMQRMEHLTVYSTISISLSEELQPGILGYIFMGMYYGVKWLFVID